MKTKSTMRRKLFLTVMLGCLVPYFIGGFYLNHRINEYLYNNSIDSSRQILIQVSELINQSLIEDMSEEVGLLASLDIVKETPGNLNNYTSYDKNTFAYKDYKVEKEIEYYFRKIEESHAKTDFIFLATAQGDYMEYPRFAPDKSYDPRERSWYQEAIKTDGIYTSEPYLTNITNEMVISFSKSI